MNDQTPKFEGQTAEPHEVDRLGIASLVLGALSLCLCCFLEIGALAGALSIVLACLSRAKLGRFSGCAAAGLVCGIFGTLIGIAMMAFSLTLYLDPEFAASLDRLFSGDLQTK